MNEKSATKHITVYIVQLFYCVCEYKIENHCNNKEKQIITLFGSVGCDSRSKNGSRHRYETGMFYLSCVIDTVKRWLDNLITSNLNGVLRTVVDDELYTLLC